MNFLFVDPSLIAARIIPAFRGRNLKIGIVVTKGSSLVDGINPNDISHAEIIDLNNVGWDTSQKVVSAVAWSRAGFEFLESISDQVALSNVDSLKQKRLDAYFDQPAVNDVVFIDTLSYKGRHVVMSVWKFVNGEWKLFQDFAVDEFKDAIEQAWANLDACGVINGPSQSYILPTGEIKLKFHPTNAAYAPSRGLVTRHWFDIWPTVTEHEEANPKKSLNTFYDWVEKTGNSKRFVTQPA